MKFTPEKITQLEDHQIFVFGSNEAARHGKGAALTALRFGASYSVPFGVSGNTFAIPTKSAKLKTLPLLKIRKYVDEFFLYAKQHPEREFLVTKIGCGLAGLAVEKIAPMFAKASYTYNVILPWDFWDCLTSGSRIPETAPGEESLIQINILTNLV